MLGNSMNFGIPTLFRRITVHGTEAFQHELAVWVLPLATALRFITPDVNVINGSIQQHSACFRGSHQFAE